MCFSHSPHLKESSHPRTCRGLFYSCCGFHYHLGSFDIPVPSQWTQASWGRNRILALWGSFLLSSYTIETLQYHPPPPSSDEGKPEACLSCGQTCGDTRGSSHGYQIPKVKVYWGQVVSHADLLSHGLLA